MEQESISRGAKSDGGRIYRHGDREIETYDESLEDFLRLTFCRLEKLVDMLGDDAWEEFGFVCEPLITIAKDRTGRICELLEKEVGTIKVDLVCRGDEWLETSTPVGVVVGGRKLSPVENAEATVKMIKEGAILSRKACQERLKKAAKELDETIKTHDEVMANVEGLEKEVDDLLKLYQEDEE